VRPASDCRNRFTFGNRRRTAPNGPPDARPRNQPVLRCHWNPLFQSASPPRSSSGYACNAGNKLTATAALTYIYDGDGNRVQRLNLKLYWYGMPGDVVAADSNRSGDLLICALPESRSAVVGHIAVHNAPKTCQLFSPSAPFGSVFPGEGRGRIRDRSRRRRWR
jgi:hypothetical protein